ncbi:hypothetical protein GCM10011504_19220 [Siccirubricoccus deserti]|uniref:hypothetical protein n=1 Tax=Siccirubricoccus deserti TaxID=2013562 RepID=UPI0019AF45E4|nr:hypothetical protein [Siccirubricoccus deserti]GGC40951.1 hypothetical protein GCM10011504_19220 [Siccirubricoccus deserti]
MPIADHIPTPPLAAEDSAPAARGTAAGALRLLALVPALGFLLTLLSPPLNHDVAAILSFAERWLGGERLYIDLIDANPPLIFVLTLLPAAIGAWTPLGAVPALLLCLLGLCALAAGVALRLARGRAEAPIEAAVLSVVLPLLTLSASYDFGQREHLMAVLALPYLLLAARRLEGVGSGPGITLGAAALAALGFALKPHFLAIPALVELLVLLGRGPWRAVRDPVPWLMAALWLAYLVAIPLAFPAYFGQVLPLIRDLYLGLGGFAWWQVLLTERLGTALMLLLPLGIVAFRPSWGALPRVLVLAALGATLAAVVQHKGWTYHALPVRIFAGLLAVVLAARWLEWALPPGRLAGVAPGAAAVAAFAIGLHGFAGAEAPWREITWSWSRAGAVSALLKREAHGERLLVLSPDIFPVYPALNYAHAQSTLRTMNLWLLQGVNAECPDGGHRYRPSHAMSRTEFFVYRTVAEDFARAPPAAILVSRNPGIPRCGEEFDFLDYFSRHPLFAETLRRYRPVAEIEGYRLLRRED